MSAASMPGLTRPPAGSCSRSGTMSPRPRSKSSARPGAEPMTLLAAVTEPAALDNGVSYAALHRPGADVTAVSVWILAGSRHEPVAGVSHLFEHVVMQAVPAGRNKRVVDEIEAWGGDANAMTARDHMVLHARVPTADAAAALEVLIAAATTDEFDDDLVDAERRVV